MSQRYGRSAEDSAAFLWHSETDGQARNEVRSSSHAHRPLVDISERIEHGKRRGFWWRRDKCYPRTTAAATMLLCHRQLNALCGLASNGQGQHFSVQRLQAKPTSGNGSWIAPGKVFADCCPPLRPLLLTSYFPGCT